MSYPRTSKNEELKNEIDELMSTREDKSTASNYYIKALVGLVELQGRNNSKLAKWSMGISISFSVIAIIISIALAYTNNQSSVEQLNTLKNIEYLLQNKK